MEKIKETVSSRLKMRLGKRARLIFIITALLVAAQAAYIIYLMISAKNGVYHLQLWETRELILNEAMALLLSVGGTALMDIEEKNAERN